MITFLSGGTGTPKLLQGMQEVIPDTEVTVVVNTAEDIWISGGHISPDIDTVLYLYARILDTGTWWGIKGDTFTTHEMLGTLGEDEYIAVGDRDRAVQITRARYLREGHTLTEATCEIARRLGVTATVLPMTDTAVSTRVRTAGGDIHFQEYWVRRRGDLPITGVFRSYERPPVATPAVIQAIHSAGAVVIGPSNPVTSILPILECDGVREALRGRRVIAVSPFIGDTPVSGPAAALMQAYGAEPGSAGTRQLYGDIVTDFIQDTRDPVTLPGAMQLDTLMKGPAESATLARAILALLE